MPGHCDVITPPIEYMGGHRISSVFMRLLLLAYVYDVGDRLLDTAKRFRQRPIF
jgi:hypothetical protein